MSAAQTMLADVIRLATAKFNSAIVVQTNQFLLSVCNFFSTENGTLIDFNLIYGGGEDFVFASR